MAASTAPTSLATAWSNTLRFDGRLTRIPKRSSSYWALSKPSWFFDKIAMSFSIAGLRASSPMLINDCATVNTSFPGFVQLAQRAGLEISTDGE